MTRRSPTQLPHYTTMSSPLGELLLLGEPSMLPGSNGPAILALTGVFTPGHRTAPSPGADATRDDRGLAPAVQALVAYFAGRQRSFALPLAPRGTPFQLSVWAALGRIAYGSTTSYGALAREVGHPGAARAVGRAVATNPLSIVVPCHRVVGASGALTGYAGGLERKSQLLALEAAVIGRGVLPT
ncbi:MAG: methylated-DNA--[protein]-cysteine S-methyltransferase [Actinomycetes bacterium]